MTNHFAVKCSFCTEKFTSAKNRNLAIQNKNNHEKKCALNPKNKNKNK